MINETILLLVYYYNPEDRSHRLLKYVGNSLGAYLPFNLYLYEPLQKIFARVILYDYLKRTTEVGMKAVNEEIIELVGKEHPKYVLWTSWQYDVQPSTLQIVRSKGSTVVGWFFDDEWRFDSYSKWWIPYLDYCVTNAITAVPKYRELGARVIQTIPNTGLAFDRDWSNIEERYEVSFVGSRFYAGREQWINQIEDRKIPIRLFGEGSGGYISFEEMIDIFRTSKINLNFSGAVPDFRVKQIKGRVFQVCMAGGFMLTEYAPGIERYFEIDKEIVCFHNTEEMIDKIVYYLNHDEERRAIAQAGWKRAVNEHTSLHMLSKVFKEIEEDLVTKDRENGLHPQKLKMPFKIRQLQSIYYFQWARVFLEEHYKGLWRDVLALSIRYNPFYKTAWYYYIVSFLPRPVRPIFFRLYGAIGRLYEALFL